MNSHELKLEVAENLRVPVGPWVCTDPEEQVYTHNLGQGEVLTIEVDIQQGSEWCWVHMPDIKNYCLNYKGSIFE